MAVVVAWCASDEAVAEGVAARLGSLLDDLIPAPWSRDVIGGADWGVAACAPSPAAWRWPAFAADGAVTAVSLGLPVGLDGTPLDLARRLLAGADVHTDVHGDVVPPYGLLALEGDRRLVVQQDWLGMARLFTATWRGVTVVASRPTLAAALAGLPVVPDQDGWASYAACGHVGGDLSVVRGVRLLAPGERQTWVRREGWSVRSERRRGVDELVLAARDLDGETALDLAADGLTRAVRSAADLSTGEVTLGLSGGKDSRVIAACFVAADRLPRFSTNVDTAAEGETAAHLLQLLRERRGLRAEHRTYQAGAPQSVHAVGLHERVRRLQHAHDFQSSWTYLSRPVGDPGLRAEARPMSFTGAGGELATAYWYPPADELVVESVRTHLMGGLAGTTQVVRELETARVDALLDHARSLGLQGLELCDYAYLVERVRRWCTSGDVLGIVTPFLHPAFVAASFAVPPSAKRLRSLHLGLLRRTVPEWADVPFVSMSTGRSTATRVWEGDGLPVLTDLLATADGCLPRLVRRDVVEAALQAVAAGSAGRREERTLQQFAWLAVASETLEPGSIRRPRPVPAPPVLPRAAVPPRVSAVARHVAFVKRSRLGARAWSAARDAVAHACG